MALKKNGGKNQNNFDETPPPGMGATGEQSTRTGVELSNSTCADDSVWRDKNGTLDLLNGKGDIGGIVGHLKFMQQACLGYIDAHAERLEARLRENRDYRSEIVERMKKLEDDVARLLAQKEKDED